MGRAAREQWNPFLHRRVDKTVEIVKPNSVERGADRSANAFHIQSYFCQAWRVHQRVPQQRWLIAVLCERVARASCSSDLCTTRKQFVKSWIPTAFSEENVDKSFQRTLLHECMDRFDWSMGQNSWNQHKKNCYSYFLSKRWKNGSIWS